MGSDSQDFQPADGESYLRCLLGSLSLEQFLAEYWERRHYVVSLGQSSGFDSLLPESMLDEFFSRNDVRLPTVSLVSKGKLISTAEYTRPLRIGTYQSDGLVDMDSVLRQYASGATIILQLMQRSFEPLAILSAKLAAFFACRVDVHAFLTPPHSQGLSAHYDTASAFLFQIRGSKRWRLYDFAIVTPSDDQKYDSRNPIQGETIEDVVLHAGDVLYIPRGLPHDGVALDSTSTHLTVVLFPRTWVDILLMALSRCESFDDFRGGLAPGQEASKLEQTWRDLSPRLCNLVQEVHANRAGQDVPRSASGRRVRWGNHAGKPR